MKLLIFVLMGLLATGCKAEFTEDLPDLESMMNMMADIFGSIEDDGDNKISAVEIRDAIVNFFDPEEILLFAEELVFMLDQDGDNLLSEDEIYGAIHEAAENFMRRRRCRRLHDVTQNKLTQFNRRSQL